jgi:predicted 2-oxoglutarate/Fe(II)-dependent dioxygenase YbiX
MLIEIPVFSKEQCNDIISEYAEDEYIIAQTSEGTESNVRQCDVKNLITENKLIENITSKIKESIQTPLDISELTFIRYTKGGQYKVHIDRGEGLPRKFSFSIPLNDTYEGGAFDVYTTNKASSRRRVTQNIGKAIFFDSRLPHAVTPVTEGTRYVIVGWINDPE